MENQNTEKKFYNELFIILQDMQAASNAYSKILIAYNKLKLTPKKDLDGFNNTSTSFVIELNNDINAIIQFLSDGYYISGNDDLKREIDEINRVFRLIIRRYYIFEQFYSKLKTQKRNPTETEKTNYLYKISSLAKNLMDSINKGIKLNSEVLTRMGLLGKYKETEKYEWLTNDKEDNKNIK